MHNDDSRPAPRDEVLFDIEMALRKGEKLWPKRYRPGDRDRLTPRATAILEHLELCGLRFFRKPPRPWHSTPDPRTGAGIVGEGDRKTASRPPSRPRAQRRSPFR